MAAPPVITSPFKVAVELTPVPLLADASGGLPDRNGNGAVDTADTEPYYQNIFPASRFESAGLPSKRWVSVEINQVANVVTWKIDGQLRWPDVPTTPPSSPARS